MTRAHSRLRNLSVGLPLSLTIPRATRGERQTFRERCCTPWVHRTTLGCFTISHLFHLNLEYTSKRVAGSSDTTPSYRTVAMHRSLQESIRRWRFGESSRPTL